MQDEDGWVFRRNAGQRAEQEAAPQGNEEEENADGVQHMDESPIHSAEHEDVAATSQNAIVAYEAPEYSALRLRTSDWRTFLPEGDNTHIYTVLLPPSECHTRCSDTWVDSFLVFLAG